MSSPTFSYYLLGGCVKGAGGGGGGVDDIFMAVILRISLHGSRNIKKGNMTKMLFLYIFSETERQILINK